MDQHAVRLLSFLPGGNLWNIPYTKDLFYQVSNCYLKIDISLNCNSLKDLKHDGLKGIEPISNLGFWIFGDIYVLHYVLTTLFLNYPLLFVTWESSANRWILLMLLTMYVRTSRLLQSSTPYTGCGIWFASGCLFSPCFACQVQVLNAYFF